MTTTEIYNFIQEVLRKRFPDNLEKQKIEESDDKLVFACPFCGDSDHKSSKKRGNFWLESESYKCFNGGCLIWLPLDKFMVQTGRRFGIHIPEEILNDTVTNTKRVKHDEAIRVLTGNPFIRFYSNNNTSPETQTLLLVDIINRFGLISQEEVLSEPEKHPEANRFLVKRGLTGIKAPMYFDEDDNKVLIFNYDRKSNRVLGYAIRKFNPTPDEPKYILKYYSDLSKIYPEYKLNEQQARDADFLNNYFNLFNLDFSKTITLVEGQIDSLFLLNGAATSGLGKIHALLTNVLTDKKRLRLFLDNDKDGVKMTMELLSKGYSVFLWSKALSDLKGKYSKDSDLIILRSIKDVNDLFLFIKSKQPELTLTRFEDFISNFFSTSAYDLMDL